MPEALSSEWQPKVSVVVPVRNGARVLGACLRALLSQDYPRERYDVLVVDNGSTDGSPKIGSRMGVRMLFEPVAGAGPARNCGVRAVDTEIVAFTDSDCEPQPGWLRALVPALADADAVTGWIEPTPEGNRFSRARATIHRYYLQDCLRLDRDHRLDRWDTANAAIRRSLFDQLGGFDPHVDFPIEDREFAARLVEKGGRLTFVESAVVRHRYETRLLSCMRKAERAGWVWSRLAQRVPAGSISHRFPDIDRLLENSRALAAPAKRVETNLRFWFHVAAAALHPGDEGCFRHYREAEKLAVLRGMLRGRREK